MPVTKNAFIRYKHLDRLLSDRHHHYNLDELTDKVNDCLYSDGFKEVGRRCIEKDLDALKGEPFNAPITRGTYNGKICPEYSNKSFSIFREELSREEVQLLREVLGTIGQFEGLAHFEWLDDFQKELGVKTRKQIISFSHNPHLQNSNLLGALFDNIANEVVVRLSYHTFADPTIRQIVFHPYLLKQYNDRWFLMGAADIDKMILNFPLDRIDLVESLPEKKYATCPTNIFNRFKNIVGVTLNEELPVEHILFWVSDQSKGYIITKPIHESQKPCSKNKEQELRTQYPTLEGGAFFTIDCIQNYELIRDLCSFGKDLLLISPRLLQNNIFERLQGMVENYSRLRT